MARAGAAMMFCGMSELLESCDPLTLGSSLTLRDRCSSMTSQMVGNYFLVDFRGRRVP